VTIVLQRHRQTHGRTDRQLAVA